VSSDQLSDPPTGVDHLEDGTDDVTEGGTVPPETDGPPAAAHPAAPAGGGLRLPSALVVVAIVLLLVAVAVAAYTTWQWQQLAAAEQAREDVEVATMQFVTTLTNWDAGAGMVETREALRDAGTETFARDVDELFGTTEDLRGLADLGARSEGEIRDVFVQSLDGDRAETFAVVLQQATTDTVEVPELHLRYASLALVQVDGRWLVDDLTLLVDSAPDATGTAPAPSAPTTDDTDTEEQP
jgi:hypothetical protein